MPLTLTITQARGGGERQTRLLTQGSLSIGRGAGNDWVLADPDQHLSRTHCMIAFEGGRYWITDLSTNGMLVNGAREPTARDSRTALTDGDTIQLGGYLLEVAEIEEHAGSSNPFGASSFVTSRTDPFASTSGHDGGNPLDVDPFDDPLSQPVGGGAFQHPMAHQPPSLRTEDPFDLAEKHGGGSDEDLFRGETPLDSWKGPAQPDTADAASHAFSAPRPVAPMNLDDIDFDALLGDIMPAPAAHPLEPPKPTAATPKPMPSADPLDDLLGDFPMPSAGAVPPPAPPAAAMPPPAVSPFAEAPQDPFAAPTPSPAVVPPSPHQAPPPAGATPVAEPQGAPPPAALLAAFLEGAGVGQLDLSTADQEATMRAIGALFRAFVSGTRDVLMSRAEIKHEMRVEQTMIRSRDNNALKFSVSPEEALVALLRPNRPGYKSPLASVEEAFNDIRSHEMAVMAGMQTGLIALLKRFDPAGLENRLQRGMLDGIMPSARKARFWELFCTTYKDIAREAEDDFHAVFGRDFARAYDAQVSKL
jgi:type VI secretion system protein